MAEDHVPPAWTFREDNPEEPTGEDVSVTLRLSFERVTGFGVTEAALMLGSRVLMTGGNAIELASLAVDHLDMVDDEDIQIVPKQKTSDPQKQQLPQTGMPSRPQND